MRYHYGRARTFDPLLRVTAGAAFLLLCCLSAGSGGGLAGGLDTLFLRGNGGRATAPYISA